MNWDTKRETIEKTLQKLIEMKYITVDKHVSISGIAAMLANDLSTLEREEQDHFERLQLLELLQKHYPEKIEALFSNVKAR